MSTKFNGVSYPVQRAAEAIYSDAGRSQVAGLISHYMGNARILRDACAEIGLDVPAASMPLTSGSARLPASGVGTCST